VLPLDKFKKKKLEWGGAAKEVALRKETENFPKKEPTSAEKSKEESQNNKRRGGDTFAALFPGYYTEGAKMTKGESSGGKAVSRKKYEKGAIR